MIRAYRDLFLKFAPNLLTSGNLQKGVSFLGRSTSPSHPLSENTYSGQHLHENVLSYHCPEMAAHRDLSVVGDCQSLLPPARVLESDFSPNEGVGAKMIKLQKSELLVMGQDNPQIHPKVTGEVNPF